MATDDKYVSVKSGEIISLDVDTPDLALYAQSGADLVISQAGGRTIVLQDFVDLADGGDAAGIKFQGGEAYSAEDVMSWVVQSNGGLEFMEKDQEELVDLDALFDALNIAAKEGVDAMDFVIDENSHEGVLTVHQRAFASEEIQSVVDSMNSDDIETFKDHILSDES